MSNFKDELKSLINKYSVENQSDTPDWILAQFIDHMLQVYSDTVRKRDAFFNFNPWDKNYLSPSLSLEQKEDLPK